MGLQKLVEDMVEVSTDTPASEGTGCLAPQLYSVPRMAGVSTRRLPAQVRNPNRRYKMVLSLIQELVVT